MYNLLERNIYDFFPLNRALSLQNEEDSNERKVEILRVQVDYMVNKMREEVIDDLILQLNACSLFLLLFILL